MGGTNPCGGGGGDLSDHSMISVRQGLLRGARWAETARRGDWMSLAFFLFLIPTDILIYDHL